MRRNVELFIEGNSHAEKYFMENIVPNLNDKPKVLLGEVFGLYTDTGTPINDYIISKKDRKSKKLKKHFDILKNIHSWSNRVLSMT